MIEASHGNLDALTRLTEASGGTSEKVLWTSELAARIVKAGEVRLLSNFCNDLGKTLQHKLLP